MIAGSEIELALFHDGIQTNDRVVSFGQWTLLDRSDVRDRFLPGLLDFLRSSGIPFDPDKFCSLRQLGGLFYAAITHQQQPGFQNEETHLAVGGLDYFPDQALARGSFTRHAILVAPVSEGGSIQPIYLDPRPGYGIVTLSKSEKESCERYFFR